MSISTSMRPKVAETMAAVADAASAAAGRGFQQSERVIDAGAARAAAGFQTTQTKISEGMEKMIKTSEEMVTFGQGNVEALVKSGQIWSAGVQGMSKQLAATAQASFVEAMTTFRAMTGIKSIKDAMEMQTNFARSAIEKTLAESGRMTDASMRLAEQTMAPITSRVTLAVEKFSRTA